MTPESPDRPTSVVAAIRARASVLRTLWPGTTPDDLCEDLYRDHGTHEWYWKNILRRQCPGVTVAPCGYLHRHGPHWCGEHHDEMCRGAGFAAVCEHGVQFLNQCDDCPHGCPVITDAGPDRGAA